MEKPLYAPEGPCAAGGFFYLLHRHFGGFALTLGKVGYGDVKNRAFLLFLDFCGERAF